MKILAIDTGMPSGSIAILEDDSLIAECMPCAEKTHAEKLLPSIDSILKSSGIRLNDIDCFAVTIGPGSFTGLRIGISTVKGFAWCLKKPVVGVSTLKTLAMNILHSDKLICPILDARKEEIYAGIYKREEETLTAEKDDCVIKPCELVKHLNRQTIFLGGGIKIYGDVIKSELGDNAVFAPHDLWHIRASNIAKLALREVEKGNIQSPETIVPYYIRRSEAETKLKQFILT
ncbi:MAG: tRNA (adenosine(37)-N6)-threonylcarbamoyltransferase complex dimerization subunit type 1 TsaB [Deltaproteobacteria bacterium]|nr:tRNA (adenosine(37)-N6)-threonylcarbamoyltransferase complex dimerization subunit type 1 TsaB [Deltaproteobacteria bacterium]